MDVACARSGVQDRAEHIGAEARACLPIASTQAGAIYQISKASLTNKRPVSFRADAAPRACV